MRLTPLLLGAAALTCLAGCPADRSPATRPTTLPDAGPVDVTTTVTPADPATPGAARPPVVTVDVFLFDLPAGTVSGDAAFWRAVDEAAVGGPAGSDEMARNGLRCGVVPRDQSASFSRYFDQHPKRVRKTTFPPGQFGTVELDLDQHVEAEDLFVFDTAGPCRGRSYADCTNGVAMTYEPEPREPDAVRVTVCPVIKSDRRRTSFTAMQEPMDTPFADVDRVYDLSLSAALRGDQMLVVAAGPTAAGRPSSVGHRFFLTAGPAERRERVVLVVPTIVPTDGRPTRRRAVRGL